MKMLLLVLMLIFLHLGFSTFLGVIVIAFSESKLFQLLFRILFSIVVLGLLHGLVFLPVLLSLFCPWKLNMIGDENNNADGFESDKSAETDVDSEDDQFGYITYNKRCLTSKCPCDFCDRFQ